MMDVYGGISPGYTDFFVLLQKNFAGIQIQTLQAFVPVYNTGKNPFGYLYGQSNTSISVGITTSTTGINLTIWIAPLDPTYNYPTNKVQIFNASLVQGVNNIEFNISTYNNTDGNGNPVVYQVLGLDFNGLAYLSVLQITNPIVMDAISIQQCTTRRGLSKLYESSLNYPSTVADNKCIINEKQREFFNAKEVGVCQCGISYAGDACTCPGIAQKVCNGYGIGGKTYSGEVVSPIDVGCFLSTQYNAYMCKIKNKAKILYTRLLPELAFDYQSIYYL
jgi:hypothetical protein